MEIAESLGRKLTGEGGLYEYLGTEIDLWRARYRIKYLVEKPKQTFAAAKASVKASAAWPGAIVKEA